MVDSVVIAPAAEGDISAIKDLLVSNELPTAGVEEHWRTFIVARDGERIVACGGAEAYQFAALIRSIAVHPDYRAGSARISGQEVGVRSEVGSDEIRLTAQPKLASLPTSDLTPTSHAPFRLNSHKH